MNNNPNYYSVLTAEVRYSPDLSAQEKLLYAEITSLSNKDGYCIAGNPYFAKLYSLTTVTVSRQITNLEKCGFIRIEYDKNGARVTQRRIFPINKNVNGNPLTINKNVNRTINKNVKENNTSNLILYNNNINATKSVDLFVEGLKKNNPKIDRSDLQKEKYAKVFLSISQTYSWEEIDRVIKFATSSDFWSKICLSADKIKLHFEKLYAQSKTKTIGLMCDTVSTTEVNF